MTDNPFPIPNQIEWDATIGELARLRALEAAVLGHWRQCELKGSTMKDLNWWLADAGYLKQVDQVVQIGGGKTITMKGGSWQLTTKHRVTANEWIEAQNEGEDDE